MLHSILNHRDGSTLPAEMFDPCAGASSIVRFGGHQDPIDRVRLGRAGEVRVANVDATFRRIDMQVRQRTSRAQDEFVLFGGL